MNEVALGQFQTLPALVDRASAALASAKTAAEILEARELASVAYDAAKRAGRLVAAKGAHDTLIAAAHRAQADALEIEAGAKRRLADEYDAAQERGEVGKRGDFGGVTSRGEGTPTADDVGLTHKDIHEARIIRDAEETDPGIVRRSLDERLQAGEEPTKASLREAVTEAAKRGLRGDRPRADNRNAHHKPDARFDAMASLVGHCRAISETLGEKAPEYILAAFIDDAMRARNLATITRCRDALSDLLEKANA